jgi:hypothetical protein
MKHFYSHALMLLVRLPDKPASCRVSESENDTRAMDRHISRLESNVRRLPSTPRS